MGLAAALGWGLRSRHEAGSALRELHPRRLGAPARGAARRHRAGGRPGRRLAVHRHGPLVPDGEPGRPRRADARGLHHARLPGCDHRAGSAQPSGHRCHLPSPGSARQDRHYPRPALEGAGDARHRSGLVRPRARRPRRSLPVDGRTVRAARGGSPDLPADVGAGRRRLRGRALPARGDRQRAAGLSAAAPADPDRGSGGEEDAAARRSVRPDVQHLRRVGRRGRPQARRAA